MAPAPQTDRSKLQPIYDELVGFLRACARDQANLSDTWVHSLKRKGAYYSRDEMETMRRPGSFVTLHINIFDYFVDDTRVDPRNEIVAALLRHGDSEVGQPLRDVAIGGQSFSSVYLKHLDIAAGIIARLTAKGIERPTILEIGGGQGLLLAALRHWYGDRLTIIAADIPETLFYQAYFLRATFPDVSVSYRADRTPVPLVRGGFNFVNAYVLASQRYDIDVAINNNSMQEMTAEVANAYLAYIDEVIAPHGTLFFRNSFGHAFGSAPEPSEYVFGPRWRLVSAGYGDFFTDSSATEFAAFVFDRTAEPQNEESRRLVLRALWNGFAGGRLTPGGRTAQALVGLDTRQALDPLLKQLKTVAGPAASWADGVQLGPHIAAAAYADADAPVDLADGSSSWRKLTAIRRMQKRLVAAMDHSGARAVDQLRQDVQALAGSFATEAAPEVAGSDYWTGYAAAILAGLHANDAAPAIIERRLEQSRNPYWRLRYGWLLARLGRADAAVRVVSRISRDALDVFWWPMAAAVSGAGDWLDAAAKLAAEQGTDELRHCLFRVNARLGRRDAAAAQFAALADADETRRASSRLNLIAFLLRLGPENRDAAESLLRTLASPPVSPLAAEVHYRLGDRAQAADMLRQLRQTSWDSYYALAGIARAYLAIGADGEAETCMNRSVELRPDNVRHFDFLAHMCFDAGRFPLAARWFDGVLAGKPYDDVFRGRAAYARLSPAVRDSRVFGAPEDQALVFQTYQSFYYPDGPQIR